MQLWTDYEGVTIDGAFPLKKLLLPEGRSAFFSTANDKGEPVVLRLIECHFDEEEILARWRCMEALNHPNFLKLERYGQIEIDSSPVVYAVFEKVDANLAGVLDAGHLSVKDAAQLGLSLTSALEMLHTHGFMHEHVSAGNIFAIGDVVKLRSDCIREAPEGEAGVAAKRRDIHDLSVVLLQALTLRQSLEGVSASAVPPPFDKIVRNGMNGSWGLAEVRIALDGRLKSTTSAPIPASATAPAIKPPAAPVADAHAPARQQDLDFNATPQEPGTFEARESDGWSDNVVRTRMRQDIWDDGPDEFSASRTKWLRVGGLVVVLVLLACWFLARASRPHSNIASPEVSSQSTAPAAKAATPKKQPASSAPSPRVNPGPAPSAAAAGSRAQWRVIAYTYNRKEDAQKKVKAIAEKHPDLHPTVFSLKRRAPYLVSIGGLMSRDAALALAHRSRSLGMPRDAYAQNYSGTGR